MSESEQTLDELQNEEKLTELELVQYPSPRLSKKALEITDCSEISEQYVKDLMYTMRLNGAIAISAPEVGDLIRLIMINIDKPLLMFNPVIIWKSSETECIEEGLLAIPGFFYTIKRHVKIIVGYQNDQGEYMSVDASGLTAMSIQHEIDILNGKIFLDKLSPISKFLTTKKVKKHMRRSTK